MQSKNHNQRTRDQRIARETLRPAEKGVRPIAFVHPYRFCERGTCENTLDLLRQYFPKKMPLDRVDLTRVGEVERALNGRPPKILEFRTPAELLSELVTNTGITAP